MARKLPVYLIIDTSGSMSGEPIAAVKNGIDLLVQDLRNNPQALETAWLSIITFDNDARQLVPLTDLQSFQTPSISATGMTALGPALSLLCECRKRECRKSWKDAAGKKHDGDYRPLVFIMSDGHPNMGDLDAGIDAFKKEKWGTAISCAAGGNADEDILKRITGDECFVKLDNLSTGSLEAYFQWISTSIQTTSQHIQDEGQSSEQGTVSDMAPLPDQLKLPQVPIV